MPDIINLLIKGVCFWSMVWEIEVHDRQRLSLWAFDKETYGGKSGW